MSTASTASTQTLTGFCTLDGATLKVSFDASEIVRRFQDELEKQVKKKGMSVLWQVASQEEHLTIRFTLIDQGNQFLRWLLPFLTNAPAEIHIDGKLRADGRSPRTFHHEQRIHVGLLGGPAKCMLAVCADRLAKDVAKEIPENAT